MRFSIFSKNYKIKINIKTILKNLPYLLNSLINKSIAIFKNLPYLLNSLINKSKLLFLKINYI